jgi:hypothetical protein
MNRTLLVTGALALSLGLIGCGAPAATNVNVKANTANTNTAAANTTANTAANTANTNAAANTAAAPATAGADQDFTVVNKTGVVIDKLYVAPSDTDNWQEDILGQDQLADGQSLEIKFHPKEKAAKWDLRIEDTKGNSIEWTDLNLTEIEKVTLNYDQATKKATANIE